MTGGPSNTRARRAFVPRIHRVGRSSSAPPAHGGYANLPRLARSRYKSYYVWGVLMILFSCAPIFGPSLACTMSSVLPNIHGEDNVWNHRKAIAWTVAGVIFVGQLVTYVTTGWPQTTSNGLIFETEEIGPIKTLVLWIGAWIVGTAISWFIILTGAFLRPRPVEDPSLELQHLRGIGNALYRPRLSEERTNHRPVDPDPPEHRQAEPDVPDDTSFSGRAPPPDYDTAVRAPHPNAQPPPEPVHSRMSWI
ncbi:hypothetical protein JCM16303_001323 [Sporobolomyces ruberrimus]